MKQLKLLSVFLCMIGAFILCARTTQDSWKVEFIGDDILRVTVNVEAYYYLYAEDTKVTPDNPSKVVLQKTPKSIIHVDAILGDKVPVYMGGGEHVWEFKVSKDAFPFSITAEWRECREESANASAMCFMPQKATLANFASPNVISKPTVTRIMDSSLKNPFSTEKRIIPHKVVRTAQGYMNPTAFLAFLNGTERRQIFDFAGRSIWFMIPLALLGGLLLNLTPCVLPLIPVNLAIIGANATSEKGAVDRISRALFYGLGITLAYGALGLAAVLSGTVFGQLTAEWWFNIVVAVIFVVLGLSMFDIFNLDFSRYGQNLKMPSAAHYGGVLLLGALAAVLAGACVAPVLVAVLLQASALYNEGNYFGLFLPFILGLGMALPWPFAAAGLTLFPKPGKWMVYIKHVLGAFIILLGAYYIYIGGGIFLEKMQASRAQGKGGSGIQQNIEEINAALRQDKTVLLDFWATWCKNCTVMEMRTFQDPEVKKALENVVLVRIQAEDPSEPETASIMRKFGIVGMPSFVLLEAEKVH